MLTSVLWVAGSYATVSAALMLRRVMKILDLHEEHGFVRSREQKGHIKTHAMTLRGGFFNDLIWIKTFPVKLKTAVDWLKAQ
jgi:hypothetical protein